MIIMEVIRSKNKKEEDINLATKAKQFLSFISQGQYSTVVAKKA